MRLFYWPNYTFLLLFLASSQWIFAGEIDEKPLLSQAVQRLKIDEYLSLDKYNVKPPTKLESAIKEYNAERAKVDSKLLLIDLKKALQENESPKISVKSSSNLVSIADIRANALKNNLDIKVAQVDPLIAATQVREEEAKFDQIIFAYAKYSQLDSPKISGDTVEFKSDNPALNTEQLKLSTIEQQKSSSDLEAGIKIPLRTGGTVSVSSPLENKVNKGKFASDEYRSALRFSISQPLLRGAGRQINEASIQIAEYSQQAFQLKTRLQSIRIIAMVDKAYWALYAAWAELDVKSQQFEYANQNLAMVKQRVKEGLTAAVEINRAEIGVADRMEALIVAETNLKLAQRQLRFYMNDIAEENSSASPLTPSTQPNLLKYEFDRNQLLDDALSGRIELLEQELKLASDLINIDYLENQTLPIFTLDYQYGALSNTNNSFNNIYQNVFNGEFNNWSVGLKFELPLSNEASKSRLDRAVQQRNQRLLTKNLQTLTVKKEIYDALDYVDQNWQRILTARQQVLIAGLNYDAELKQFNEGLRTMTEVLETLTRLGEAQIKEVRAISDYQIALVDMAYATGTLMGYSKLTFE
jgi:outer membrane protein TolC